MDATSALSASRASGAAFICAAIDAQCAAAATATCGDAAAAAAGKACDLQKFRVADSFAGRPSSAAAAASAPCSANRPKYADSPSASSAADLLTFSTFSFGHAARSSSTTVLAAISPSVGALLLFVDDFAVPAASDPGARAATSAATKSNAARRAVTPPPLDPSSASSAASSSAASPHACTLAYSSGSSASISRSASVKDTCGTTHSRTNAERRAIRDASSSGPSEVVSASYAPASPHSTTAASVANAAAAAGGVATPGASDATRLAAPTIVAIVVSSSDAACLDTSAAPSRIPRFVAIHAVSETFSGFFSAADSTARATASIAHATSRRDERSASGMCARTRR